MTDDIAIQKRRFKIFIVTDLIMAAIVMGGFFAEFARGIEQARPVWILALLVGFAMQLWFIMGFRKSLAEEGR